MYSICCLIDVMIVSIDIIGDWIVSVCLNVHQKFHVVQFYWLIIIAVAVQK